jgi:uncharacterized protein (TIGR03067 family)
MLTVEEALTIGVRHHQAGNLVQAEKVYQQILEADRSHPDAWHLLGVVALQVGKYEPAIDCLRYAATLNEDNADIQNNLGIAYSSLERWDAAAEAFYKALQLRPEYAEAHCNIGNMLRAQGRYEDAIPHYETALKLNPDYEGAKVSLEDTQRRIHERDNPPPVIESAPPAIEPESAGIDPDGPSEEIRLAEPTGMFTMPSADQPVAAPAPAEPQSGAAPVKGTPAMGFEPEPIPAYAITQPMPEGEPEQQEAEAAAQSEEDEDLDFDFFKSPAPEPDLPPDDRPLLKGTWNVVQAEVNGKVRPLEKFQLRQFVVADETAHFVFPDGGPGQETPFKLDQGAIPKTLDLVAEEGTNACIYELTGDNLKICMPMKGPGSPRPDSFATGPGSNRILLSLERG